MSLEKDSLLKIQARVIGALLMREILIRYGRHNIGFLWIIVEPMLFTLGVTTLWTLTRLTHGSSLPITAFALTGYSSVLVWRNTVTRCTMAVRANRSLLHHRYIEVLHLFLARITLEISSVTMSFLILSITFISMGLMDFPDNILTILFGWLLLIWFAVALALMIGAISEHFETVERLWHTVAYLLFPMSGAAFMVDWLPQKVQEIVLWLPMIHGVELVREGFFGSTVHTHYSIQYMSSFCLVLSLLSLAMVKETSRRVGSE
ncbi:ABC transporter permease [Fluoribacter gormanii]|uniref:Transport permease protein n=1 Tax=Fluoribacter gormanii TaxID=464 RepID=A0A377GMY9_9GAMM|nr:ABC transporter permease [Fluoribacter gormanii]KTD00213.1 Capsule polysaccharide export inner-membrane protein ctrC [Fluoribacter gormanii]MCW8445466.1 ABC transporter permease [Fluoribacter gormanii]MCW8470716.1 ABC transporter permease [Fluoribacter gormanii]SIR86106.1 capsular polysaccharide transport system permease protein [Fluoribacter gormanii]STO26166.1 Polysialic acid transport protein kpsM [Fluoribacter gormanii]